MDQPYTYNISDNNNSRWAELSTLILSNHHPTETMTHESQVAIWSGVLFLWHCEKNQP